MFPKCFLWEKALNPSWNRSWNFSNLGALKGTMAVLDSEDILGLQCPLECGFSQMSGKEC